MIAFSSRNKNNVLSALSALVLSFAAIFVLQGCGSSGGDAPVVDANPTGYYSDGGATIKTQAEPINGETFDDLQGMISGDRFMIMSIEAVILYDGAITSINGNDFTADVKIYHGMNVAENTTPPVPINTTITGTIAEGSQITGIIAGTGIGTGDFSLTYSQTNSALADVANIVNSWTGAINSVPQALLIFPVDASGGFVTSDIERPFTGIFSFCEMTGNIASISNSTLFNLNLNLTSGTCIEPLHEGDYTGFATTKDVSHDTLIVMFSNGAVSGIAEWTEVLP